MVTTVDMSKRIQMALKFWRKLKVRVVFFHCCGCLMKLTFTEMKVNPKTKVYSGTQRPIEVAEKPLHSEKCTVCSAISGKGIIEHFSFKESGMSVTVTKERYV